MPRLSAVLLAAGLCVAASCALPSAPTLAAPIAGFTDPTEIDRAVSDYAGAALGQPGGPTLPVDRRLRLTRCASPLALSWRGSRHDSVLVECPDLGGWRLYVPMTVAGGGAIAVARGEALTVIVRGDGFAVSQPGQAMEAGAVGDWIRVRSLRDTSASASSSSGGDPIRGRIVRPGLVEVPLD
jgi:flagella basal body P-ring formation protein FlgA